MAKKGSKITKQKQEAVDACVKWAINHGSSIPDLYQFKYDAQKFGVYCKLSHNDLVHQEQLKFTPLKIDESILISNDLALKFLSKFATPKELQSLRENHINILLKLFLTVSLQAEEDPMTKEFKPYFDVLPKNISSSIFWSKEELEVVSSTDLSRKTSSVLKNTIEAEIEAISKLKLPFTVTENLYKWAHCIVSSRGFPAILLENVTNKISKIEAFLWPVVDFLNHSNNVQIQWSKQTAEKGNSALQFVTVNSHLNGAGVLDVNSEFEIFNNYGENKNSEDCIILYGFALENVNDDFVTITTRVENEEFVKSCEEDFLIKFAESFKDPNDEKSCIVKMPLYYNKFPIYLIKFFSVACRSDEKFISRRSTLDGLNQINAALNQLLKKYKKKIVSSSGKPIQQDVIDLIRKYQNNFKKILSSNLELVDKYTTSLLTETKDLLSFKTEVNTNSNFQKLLYHHLHKSTYKELLQDESTLSVSILMFIIYQSNKEISIETVDDEDYETTSFIRDTFTSVARTYKITDEEYLEYASSFALFIESPSSIFSFTLEDFIIADIIVDKIVWQKPSSREIFFIKEEEYSLS